MPAKSFTHRTPNTWQKITVTADSLMTEAIAAFLVDLSGTGVEIAPDKKRDTGGQESLLEEITAYIPIALSEPGTHVLEGNIRKLKQFLVQVGHIFPDCPAPRFVTETIIEEDWGRKWKSFFTSLQITPSLVIKPSWETPETKNKAGRHPAVIEMDPGLAFGTGHHASTKLALLLLDELFHNKPEKFPKVLDVGTGSGILAMACGLFGASEIMALDNDPDAVATADKNIIRNRLEDKITVSDRDISTLRGAFNIVVANITHDTLAELSTSLANLLQAPGYLVLSGILKGGQEYSIRKIYTKQGLEFIKSLTQDEWAALLMQKIP